MRKTGDKMKKIGNKIKQNAKAIAAFLLGIALTGGTVYAATVLPSSQVGYDNSTSGLAATDVQGALDELFTKTNTWIDPSYIDFGTLATNTPKTVLASKNGVCIKRNNKVSCFKANNWSVEKDHIQQVFSDNSCTVGSYYVGCNASDFRCYVVSDGLVDCYDLSDNSNCEVDSDGSVSCR